MGALPVVSKTVGPRARHWDVVVLGSGIAGLVAAARLGMAGQRVLIVEEAAAHDAFPGLREPFYLAGLRKTGVLNEVLRELGVPLIERRRLEPTARAFQVVAPNLRMDLGTRDLTQDELEHWGLATRAEAQPLLQALERAAEAEQKAMLESPLVYTGRRSRLRSPNVDAFGRGLPPQVHNAPPRLARLFEIIIETLSNRASTPPSSEARARLLGSLLSGGVELKHGPPWLHGLLRRRVEAHFGEFRTTDERFQLVSAGGHPGLSIGNGRELWLGRALVVAASSAALSTALDQSPIPSFLTEERPTRRRVTVHWTAPKRSIPGGMGQNLILVGDSHPLLDFEDPEKNPPETGPAVTLSIFGGEGSAGECHLVAASVSNDGEKTEAVEARIEKRVRLLFPFENGSMKRLDIRRPRWDDDNWLEDPPRKLGWPTQVPLRVSSRPPVYRLDRSEIGGLGLEGDLLLGWRGGDAIASELS